MKIIFFNINDAKTNSEGLSQFIKKQKDTTDIFCFQDVYDNSKKLLQRLLPEYKKASTFKYVTEQDFFKPATFIKPSLDFEEIENIIEDKNTLGSALYTKIRSGNKILHLVNIHGLSRPTDKLDSPQRMEQSENIIKYLDEVDGIKIIGGDFNLFPNTNSIKLIEKAGYKNLISEFNIKSTRNEVVWRKFPDTKQYFSDYVFAGSELTVSSFEVPYNEFSDHLPLIINIDF